MTLSPVRPLTYLLTPPQDLAPAYVGMNGLPNPLKLIFGKAKKPPAQSKIDAAVAKLEATNPPPPMPMIAGMPLEQAVLLGGVGLAALIFLAPSKGRK